MEFYYNHNGEIIGPLAMEGMGNYPIQPETLVWMEGMPNWLPAGSVPEFKELFLGRRPTQPVQTIQPVDEQLEVFKGAPIVNNNDKLASASEYDLKKPALALGILSIIMFVIEIVRFHTTLGFIIYIGTAIAGFKAYYKCLELNKERLLGDFDEAFEIHSRIKITLIIAYIAWLLGVICTIRM